MRTRRPTAQAVVLELHELLLAGRYERMLAVSEPAVAAAEEVGSAVPALAGGLEPNSALGRRRSAWEAGVDDVVDETASLEAVIAQDAFAREAGCLGEPLHRDVLREGVDLDPVQAEIALRPAHE